MTYKQVWHVTIQSGKRDEVMRALREEVVPLLARDPDFVACRFYRTMFGPDFGSKIEFEYRTLEGATKLTFDPELAKLMAPKVFALLSSNHAELLWEQESVMPA